MNRKLYKHKDNVTARLLSGISASTLSIPLQSGNGTQLPTTATATATSTGTSTALNSTGIQSALTAAGVVVGDVIENVTDGSYAVIKSISTNSIVTSRLRGGTANLWSNTHKWCVNRFVITLVKYDPTDGVTVLQREKVLIDSRSGDNLTVNATGRGFDGSTAASFAASDYAYLFMTSSAIDGIQQAIAQVFLDADAAVDTLQTVAYLAATNVWTGVQSFTADLLQITTDPNSGNDPVRSSYLDSTLAALTASLITTLSANAVYGDGSDGVVNFDGVTTYPAFSTLSSGVYTLTRNVYGTTVTISNAAIIDEANAEIFATVGITRATSSTAKFRNNGNPGNISSVGGAGKAGITLPGTPSGGNGGGGTSNNAQGGAGNAGGSVTLAILGAGSGGGAGGTGSGGGPGAGGGGGAAPLTNRLPHTVDLATRFFDYITGTLQLIQTASGSGGGGGGWGTGASGSTGGGGGGGGAPAGIVKVSTPTITDLGTGTMFEAIGGAGGAGNAATGGTAASGGGGGGGGRGGVIIRICHSIIGAATCVVTGGAGGVGGVGVAGGGTGVTGTAGSAGQVFDLVV